MFRMLLGHHAPTYFTSELANIYAPIGQPTIVPSSLLDPTSLTVGQHGLDSVEGYVYDVIRGATAFLFTSGINAMDEIIPATIPGINESGVTYQDRVPTNLADEYKKQILLNQLNMLKSYLLGADLWNQTKLKIAKIPTHFQLNPNTITHTNPAELTIYELADGLYILMVILIYFNIVSGGSLSYYD